MLFLAIRENSDFLSPHPHCNIN